MAPDQVAIALAKLEGTFLTEVGHITKRLDSHSDELKDLRVCLCEIQRVMAGDEAVEQYRERCEAACAEENRTDRRFWQSTKVQVILLIASWIGSGVVGSWINNLFKSHHP